MEKLDVARMMLGMELVAQRMADDHRAAGPHQRLSAVHVEQVADPGALHEDRIHDRVDVVRTDVRDADDQDVGLSLDRDCVLLEDLGQRLFVHRVGLAGPYAGHAVGRGDS